MVTRNNLNMPSWAPYLPPSLGPSLLLSTSIYKYSTYPSFSSFTFLFYSLSTPQFSNFFSHFLAFSFLGLLLFLAIVFYSGFCFCGNECSSSHKPQFSPCFPHSWVGLQAGEESSDTFQRDQGWNSGVFVHGFYLIPGNYLFIYFPLPESCFWVHGLCLFPENFFPEF